MLQRLLNPRRFSFLFIYFLFFIRSLSAEMILREWRGDIEVIRPGTATLQPFQDMPLYRSDFIETKQGGYLKIFWDHSLRISLGPKTKLVVENLTSEKLLLKITRGILKVEELKRSTYQIKTPSAYVSGAHALGSYFITTFFGQTDVICLSGLRTIREFDITYDGSIPNGFIRSSRQGVLLRNHTKSSIYVNDQKIIRSPTRPVLAEKSEIKALLDSTTVIAEGYELSEKSIYDIISMDTPTPGFDMEEINKILRKSKTYTGARFAPKVFNPEAKFGFSAEEF